MAERKNFLLLAVAMGIAGIAIGAVTIINAIPDIMTP